MKYKYTGVHAAWAVLVINILWLAGCSGTSQKEPAVNVPAGCGILSSFSVGTGFCEQMQVPQVGFAVQWPVGLDRELPRQGATNQHYGLFFQRSADETLTESILLGVLEKADTLPIGEDLAQGLFRQFGEAYQNMGFSFSQFAVGTEMYQGREVWSLQAKGSIDNPQQHLKGNYLLFGLLVHSRQNQMACLYCFRPMNSRP